MAQSDSDVSNNVMQESVSDVEAELNALTPNTSNQFDDFEIGSTVCAVSNPTVEGLIVGKVDTIAGNVEMVILVPGYKKKGHAPIFATVVKREISKLSKRQVRKYAFPMPNLEKWQSCVRKHKKDFSWTTAAIQVLNASDKNYLQAHSIQASPREATRKILPSENFNKEVILNTAGVQQSEDLSRKRNSQTTDKSKPSEAISLCEDSDMSDIYESLEEKASEKRKKPKTRKAKSITNVTKKAKKTKRSSSSLSDSSSASSKSTSTDTTSSKSSAASSQAKCPFSFRDSRGNRHVKARMKGKAEERKYIRSALHNLYSSYSSMKCVVNDIRARTLATGGRPLTFDLIWLEQHAIYLDTLMFESFRGVWKQWNEPVVDELSLAFLELLVRVSPRREYSDRLDEKVRKWMKKKRIGVSQRYGPVPAYLQQAKITEAGIFAHSFAQRRWSSTQSEKPSFNGTTYRPNFRQFQAGVQKQNGSQTGKQQVPAQV